MRLLYKITTRFLFLFWLIASDATGVVAQDRVEIPFEVKESIHQRVDRDRNVGIVVGIVSPRNVEYYGYGRTRAGGFETPDENSVFEIGSISKVFTSILLADQVVRGKIGLDDPVQNYVPDSVSIPSRNGEQISFANLATHMSALPRLPDNMAPADPANPYADYTVDQMYTFLSGHELSRDIGSQYEYSNLAVGFLGHVLAIQEGVSYENLLGKRILTPLGMESTGITFTEDMRSRLARGHDQGTEVSNWDIPTLAGAGAIRSTARDMLRFLVANMRLETAPEDLVVEFNPLYEAMQLSHQTVVKAATGKMDMALGWHVRLNGDVESVWHNGGTGGYRSFAGFNRDGSLGVVVLTNSTAGVDDLGFHLLDDTYPLQTVKYSGAAMIRTAIDDRGVEAAWETYHEMREAIVDEYEFNEQTLNAMGYQYLQNGNVDAALAVFQMNVDAFPESSNPYDSVAEAYLANGDTTLSIANYRRSLELNPGNDNAKTVLAGLGISDASAAVTVAEEVLESYVGEYQLAPSFVLVITLENGQLKAQATGQPKLEIFPSSNTEFYWKVVDAQLTFSLNESGSVVSVTLHQGGADVPGAKIK